MTALRCWAVGSTVGTAGASNAAAIVATTDGGSTWRAEPIPATVAYLSAVSCSDLSHCTAVGQATQTPSGLGAIITTANGGTTWTPATVPAGVLDVTAVACQPDRHCLATASTGAGTVTLAASRTHSSWAQLGALPPALTGATSIDCLDALHCWVTAHVSVDVDHVAGQVAVTTNGGTTWTTTAAPTGVGYLNDIVCTGGPGGQGLPFTTTAPSSTTAIPSSTAFPPGTTLGSTTTAPPTTVPTPSTTTTTAPAGVPGVWCVAVGTSAATVTGTRTGHGVVVTTVNGGASWSSQRVATSTAGLLGVSCTAVNSCVAVGSAVALEPQAGIVVLTGPGSRPWRTAAAVFAPQALTAVSCTSASHCLMVGESISEHLVGGG